MVTELIATGMRCFVMRWRFIGSLVVLLILLAAAEADAACGDYVVIGNPQASTMSVSMAAGHGSSPERSTGESWDALGPEGRERSECDGPQCRRQLPVVPAQSPFPPPVTPDQSACLPQGEVVPSLFSLPCLCKTQGSVPAGFSPRIERPPRPRVS